ncbi:hypothetical protein ACIPRM_39065 [Streptomyces anulatus]
MGADAAPDHVGGAGVTDSETGAARAQDLEVEITSIDYIAARY